MFRRVEEYPDVSKHNLCPYCRDPRAIILTPLGSLESKCRSCRRWFKTRYATTRITHDTTVEIIEK